MPSFGCWFSICEEMASVCRSVAMAGARSVAFRSSNLLSKTLTPKATMTSPFPPSTRIATRASSMAMALGSLESLMPLHSATASTRLVSIIAVDSSCWSWLSQAFAVPR
ncbi:protein NONRESPONDING TO OXYLIPINS 2, mitochondrial-like isoform X2 [Telopea speciosissima]|uniref:protein NONRESPONDING TO OXYLIPINS 2, mitochondrial-like isoform X2 n=1 Tax=Telopea speciosissima TaxID=54955 RepID=UPI001CC4D9D6|nr:protein NONRESPONDING TO OXYLIPINS 2, mitochondrial-like isoform X2 [Telopea speciosissima]